MDVFDVCCGKVSMGASPSTKTVLRCEEPFFPLNYHTPLPKTPQAARNISGSTGDELLTLKVFKVLARHPHSSRRLQNVLGAVVPFLVIVDLPFGREGESTSPLELSDVERYVLTFRSLALASCLLELVGAVAVDIPLLMKASSAANCAIISGERMALAFRELTEYCDTVDEKDRKDQDRAKKYERELQEEMQKLEGNGEDTRKGPEKEKPRYVPMFIIDHPISQRLHSECTVLLSPSLHRAFSPSTIRRPIRRAS